MNWWSTGSLIALLCVPAVVCPAQAAELSLEGYTMGTRYQVKIVNNHKKLPDRKAFHSRVEKALKRVNEQMSTYLSDSELSRFNRFKKPDTWFPVSEATARVVARSLEISQLTEGAFDATLGPLVNMWGFGPDDRPLRIPAAGNIRKVLGQTGYQKLSARLNPPALRKSVPSLYTDLSGIAKGWGVDVLADLVRSSGSENYMVEIGGEIRVNGQKSPEQSWKIAVERPDPGGKRAVFRVLSLKEGAIATSGDYRNYYEKDGERYSHIIDPRNGRPLKHHLVSVTVLAATTMDADAMATAMFVMGPDKIKEFSVRNKIPVFYIQSTGGKLSEWASPVFIRDHPAFAPVEA